MKRQVFCYLAAALIALSVAVTSCGDKDGERQPPLFPLEIGNSWSYKDTGKYEVSIATMSVQYAYTIAGITGFTFSEYTKGAPVSLFKNDSDGSLIEYFFDKEKLVYSTVRYKKNVKKSDTWMFKSAVFSNGDYSKYKIEERVMTCITSDTLITTPKGNFRCMGFSYHPGGTQPNGDPNHTMVDFLSENIGRVKMLHYEHENGKTWLFSEQTLIDYSLK